jgi:DhnA family fructose-bisphosphate aldolase class Ia
LFAQIGRGLRISRIFSQDGKALIIGLDSAFLGHVKNLLETRDILTNVLRSKPDAIILNKGQLTGLESLIGRESAILLRADFTNLKGFLTLPLKKLEHVKLINPKEALMLGSDGIVACLFIGDEDEEARSIRIVSTLVSGCRKLGLPLMIESILIGERVTEANRLDCLKLAVRMAIEAGADLVAVPYIGNKKTMHTITEVAGQIPILVIDNPEKPLTELKDAISSCAGLVLRERLASGNVEDTITEARILVHGG